ncbi:Polypyrimidine tract-binding protein-like 1 [Glycine soja]|uniref:Polypyrimidine tract-binding protein-like 1 n=1 Tax=Glycine soja TaxID=3848 RepID=A0A445FBB3_GLYSO|nr:Polypyrimidine tract-binding protein-like 1 [Glycine soja]
MVSHYSSSDFAQLHGKTIYVQYSKRQEFVVNKFTEGNILIVSMEGIQAGDISIDAIHLVFSAFGYVHKISTFEKSAGFQVHPDLNIKFQSNRSRDYTNPTLPVNQASIVRTLQPIPRPTENHVLWASFENMQYDVTVDVLHAVFCEIDVATATTTKKALEGHCIYDGGYCKLRLSYSRHTDINVKGFSKKSRYYTRPNHSVSVEQVPAIALENPHATSMYGSSSARALQDQVHAGQIPSWNPIYSYMPAPGTFPNQTYVVPPYPAYALGQSNNMVHNESYVEITPPGVPGYSPHMHACWFYVSHILPDNLHSPSSPWPFAMWGMDILGPLPKAPREVKYLLIVIDYFTKWIENFGPRTRIGRGYPTPNGDENECRKLATPRIENRDGEHQTCPSLAPLPWALPILHRVQELGIID